MSLLTNCYLTSKRKLKKTNDIFLDSALPPLLLLRKPKLLLQRVSVNILRLGKRWEIQQVVLACPPFRGQSFKGKGALCSPRLSAQSLRTPLSFLVFGLTGSHIQLSSFSLSYQKGPVQDVTLSHLAEIVKILENCHKSP